MGVRITSRDLWIGSFYERRPLKELEDSLDHIHGRFAISVDGRFVPSLGYFGPDDVCLNAWLYELWMITGRLSGEPMATYDFDEGEQGQPCFRFERDHSQLFVTIAEGSGGGLSNSEWQRVQTPFDDFQHEVVRFTDPIHSILTDAAPELGPEWFNDQVGPALAEAYQRRSLLALETLMSLGLRPNAIDSRWTALRVIDLAISDGEHEIVELLARYGADLEPPDESGLTALHRCARSADKNRMIETLLSCGADVSIADRHGWTALHHAAAYGYHDNVELLLNHGADRAARTHSSLTAADPTTTNNHPTTVKALNAERP